MTCKIIVADDHPIIIGGVRALLEADPSLSVVAQASSPSELLEAVAANECDLIVTDLNMADGKIADGFHMVQALRRRWPRIPLVVLTQHRGQAVLQALSQCGVRTVVHKSNALQELLPAVSAARQSLPYASEHVQSPEATVDDGTDLIPDHMLTEREADVLRLFATGRTVTEIASHFSRSVKTISNHKSSAMDKLGLRTDLDIYNYARTHGLTQ